MFLGPMIPLYALCVLGVWLCEFDIKLEYQQNEHPLRQTFSEIDFLLHKLHSNLLWTEEYPI